MEKIQTGVVEYENAEIRGGYFRDHPNGEDIWIELEREQDGWELEMTFSEALAFSAILLSALISLYGEKSHQKES